jgi:23S rRNA pseudouridine2605 synthase
LTAEQLEASRAERLRHNGHGPLTLEDARTWIEETGLCLFLPKRQFTSSVAPSFVEAVAGQRDATPDPKHIVLAEELLVRLEAADVAVRLNLLGQPGEHPDYVVASWVLPYVYALRGDRDWRRSPQLTGSRQVSQLAVQAYKLLEAADATIPSLKHALGREVTEGAVLRAITELWQQLRIIPVVAAPGQAPKWQLLRHRYQKAIAEGASTSQVTAISVLASIYLQAVIAASMEEVELFLAPLTARSKVREVLRGLVATRQIHTLSVGHAPHFYVAGTLPAFTVAPTLYASSSMSGSSYFLHSREHEEDIAHEAPKVQPPAYTPPPQPHRLAENYAAAHLPANSANHAASNGTNHTANHTSSHTPRTAPPRKPAAVGKPAAARPHFSRPATPSRNRKPGQPSAANRPARRAGSDARVTGARPAGARPGAARPGIARPTGPRPTGARPGAPRTAGTARPSNGARKPSGPRWSSNGAASANGNRTHSANGASKGARTNGNNGRPVSKSNGRPVSSTTARGAKPSSWSRNGHSNGTKAAGKPTTNGHSNGLKRKDTRTDSRKPALTAGAKAGNSKRYGFTARPKRESKKRG